MTSRLMLSRAAGIALRALVELAREPALTLSVAELARRQQLPQPMLEQILLRLRRAALVEARRGRQGGYRLAQQAETLSLARVLQAVERPAPVPRARPAEPRADAALDGESSSVCDDRSALTPGSAAVELNLGHGGRPADASLEELERLEASAGHRVEQQLRSRLERLVQMELQRLTLAELLYDQRSWEASLGPEGGVILS